MLYDLNRFDQILAGHDIDQEARFLIASAGGVEEFVLMPPKRQPESQIVLPNLLHPPLQLPEPPVGQPVDGEHGYGYQSRGESIVTIQKEMDALRSYIDFSSIRFRYAFEYAADFDEEILDCAIPKQIFQPVAENYFAHGLRGDGEDRIDIRGYLVPKADMGIISAVIQRFRQGIRLLTGKPLPIVAEPYMDHPVLRIQISAA